MMLFLTIGLLSLIDTPAAAGLQSQAQTTAPAAASKMMLPEIEGAVIDPTCGGASNVAQIATCVASTQAGLQGLADQYMTAFEAQGWLAAGGDDNRMVFVRRRDGGGCDGFQVQAFTDETRVPNPAEPAFLAFAIIPGNVCADPDASGATAQ